MRAVNSSASPKVYATCYTPQSVPQYRVHSSNVNYRRTRTGKLGSVGKLVCMHMGVGLAGRSAVLGGGAAPRSTAAASRCAATACLYPLAVDPCSAWRLRAGMPPEVTESACILLLTRLRHFWDGMCNVLHKVG